MNEPAPAEAPAAEAPAVPAGEAPAVAPEPPNLRQDAANVPDPDFVLPEQYAGKKWAEQVRSNEDAFKLIDNLNSMIGKKSIPEADASDEQLEEFYSQLRPETHEAYELTLPEGTEAEINDEQQLAAKEFFHKNGFTQKQAQALFEFDLQRSAAAQPDEAALDAKFGELMNERFGDKANDALKIAHTHLATESQEAKDAFSSAPPELMTAVINILNNNHNRFAGEDISPETGASGAGQTTQEKLDTITDMRLEAKKMDPGRHRDEALAKIEKLEKENSTQFAALNKG